MDGEVREGWLSEIGPKSKPDCHRPVFRDSRENSISIQVTLDTGKLKCEQQAQLDAEPAQFGRTLV